MKKLSGILMIMFMGMALLISIPAIFSGYTDTQKPTSDNLINGQWSSLFETNFSETLFPRNISMNLWGITELALFHEGRKGVLIGKEGWLFTDEEFIAEQNRDKVIQNNKNFILETAETLNANQVNLVITLIPSKARIEEEKLGKYNYPSYNNALYAETISFLSDNNIDAPSLIDILSNQEDVFFKTDTHWTPKGSLLTAQEISRYITENNLFTGTESYVYTTPKSEEFDGDLMKYVHAGKLTAQYGIKQNQSLYRDVFLIQPETNTTSLEDDLFGDKTIPVTLVGTSYSANPRWNFENHLKHHLNSDIYNAADEGLGPYSTMNNYLDSEEYKNSPPQLVIWEIPERYISIPKKE